MEPTKFTTKRNIKGLHQRFPDAVFYDTSRSGSAAMDYDFVTSAVEFCPFTRYGNIPVPGMDQFSDTVEGVWQGLKIIKGKTDPRYFKGKGRARYGRVQGHLFGDKKLSYVEAREKIYVPSYEFMIHNCVPTESLEKMFELAKKGIPQFFFDVDENGDIHNTKSPLAHSAVLVEILNRELLDNGLSRYSCGADSARR